MTNSKYHNTGIIQRNTYLSTEIESTMAKENRKEGYYWVKWDIPSMGWSICYWTGTDWYAINCEEAFSDATFEIISSDPIPEPA